MKRKIFLFLFTLLLVFPMFHIRVFAINAFLATKTTSKVLVDGVPVSFAAYNFNGNNYFKIRDIAIILSGTKKQFDVSWDVNNNAINLLSNKPYTIVGREMNTKQQPPLAYITTSKSKILLDYKYVDLTAYIINKDKYFKLRDLGKVINFAVEWDGRKNTIYIKTDEEYKEENFDENKDEDKKVNAKVTEKANKEKTIDESKDKHKEEKEEYEEGNIQKKLEESLKENLKENLEGNLEENFEENIEENTEIEAKRDTEEDMTTTSVERKIFLAELAMANNPTFSVTNVINSSLEYNNCTITAEAPVEIAFDFIFANISIEKDGVQYSDQNEQPISSVANESNKYIIPAGVVLPESYYYGYTLQFDEPGRYIITTNHDSTEMNIILTVIKKQGLVLPNESPKKATASPLSCKVLANSSSYSINGYIIDGDAYFMLPDLEIVLNGTNKQFYVWWDIEKGVFDIRSKDEYMEEDYKMGVCHNSGEQEAVLSNYTILVDGREVSSDVCNINGYTYFKLRDIARALNISTTWNDATKNIEIDTSISY